MTRITLAGGIGTTMAALSRILAGPGIRIRVLITDSYHGQNTYGDESVEFIRLDVQDAGSLKAAFQDTERACLWTGAHADHAGLDQAFVDAASLAGATFLVNVRDNAWACARDMLDRQPQDVLGRTRIHSTGHWIVTTLVCPSIYMESIFALATAWVPLGHWGGTAGNGRAGLVDRLDVLTAMACILREGPERHGEKVYYLTGPAAVSMGYIADYLSQSLDHRVTYRYRTDEEQQQIYRDAGWSPKAIAQIVAMEKSIRLGLAAKTTDDLTALIGRPAKSVIEWITEHRADFIAFAQPTLEKPALF